MGSTAVKNVRCLAKYQKHKVKEKYDMYPKLYDLGYPVTKAIEQ